MLEIDKSPPGAFLASIITPEIDAVENSASLEELRRLCESLGHTVQGQMSQKAQGYGSPTVFGEGKLTELATAIHDLNTQGKRVHSVVFDRELSPLQSRNVETAVNGQLPEDEQIRVTDRTGVIIDIFSARARTRQSRLQIEMAKLKYESPRIRDQIEYHGDRLGGGIGAKGIGETAVELKRRQLRDRLAALRRELEDLEAENQTRLLKRDEQSVALVGYTNSGKSTLMRGLTESDVYVADRLFATLDVTTRQLSPPATPQVLVTDTVGFVRHLPHDLVASFKSTLAEACHANLLLHVIDASDPEFPNHMSTTDAVLKEIGADHQDRILVFNKVDKISPLDFQRLKQAYPNAWMTCALETNQIGEVRDKIIHHFESKQVKAKVEIPFSEMRIMGELHKLGHILTEAHDETGTQLTVLLKPVDLDRLRHHFPRVTFAKIT